MHSIGEARVGGTTHHLGPQAPFMLLPDVLYLPLLLHQWCQYQHSHRIILKIILTSQIRVSGPAPRSMEHSMRSASGLLTPSNPQIAGLSGLRPPEKQPRCGCYSFLDLFLIFSSGFSQHSASRSVSLVACLIRSVSNSGAKSRGP